MHSPRTVHPISTVNCHDKISLDKCQRKCLTNVTCLTFLDKMWKMKATVQCSVRWETGPGCRLPCRCCPRCRLPCTCCHAAIARTNVREISILEISNLGRLEISKWKFPKESDIKSVTIRRLYMLGHLRTVWYAAQTDFSIVSHRSWKGCLEISVKC